MKIIGVTVAIAVAGTCYAASPSSPGQPIYVYMKGRTWCAVSDKAAFKRMVERASADQQDVDEGTVWLSGGQVMAVEEFRTDADAEWSTLIKYHVDMSGHVTSAEASFQSDDAGHQKAKFAVANGTYTLITGPRAASSYKFRRASTLTSFPFTGLARALTKATIRESCG